jgi:hypothetical protein
MSMTRHVILSTVDTPLKILFWTVPELLMLITPCFVGLILDQLSLGLLTSLFYFWGAKKYQQHFGKGQFQAVKYWFFPPDKRFKSLAPSFIREYFG